MSIASFLDLQRAVFAAHASGRYREALALIDRKVGLLSDQTARILFWRACLHSLLGECAQAIVLLQKGLAEGHWWAPAQLTDPDLDSLHDLPEFKEVVRLCEARREEAQARAGPELIVHVPEACPSPFPVFIALHGRDGGDDPAGQAAAWQAALDHGWLLALPRSSQVFGPTTRAWDAPEQAGREIGEHFRHLVSSYPVDLERVVLAGYSQGGGLALWLVVGESMPARRCVAVAPSLRGDLAAEGFVSRLGNRRVPRLEVWILIGERDPNRDSALELGRMLTNQGAACHLDVVPGLGHQAPSDLDQRLSRILEKLG